MTTETSVSNSSASHSLFLLLGSEDVEVAVAIFIHLDDHDWYMIQRAMTPDAAPLPTLQA